MAVSVFPALLAAGYTQAQALLGDSVLVTYGMTNTDDPGDYLMLGVDDPEAEWMVAAATTRNWESVGINADVTEEGDIPCIALSWNGDGNLQSAVETAYSIAESVIGVFRAAPNLGLIAVDWTLPGSETACMYQVDGDGVKARLEFSIHFQALI